MLNQRVARFKLFECNYFKSIRKCLMLFITLSCYGIFVKLNVLRQACDIMKFSWQSKNTNSEYIKGILYASYDYSFHLPTFKTFDIISYIRTLSINRAIQGL